MVRLYSENILDIQTTTLYNVYIIQRGKYIKNDIADKIYEDYKSFRDKSNFLNFFSDTEFLTTLTPKQRLDYENVKLALMCDFNIEQRKLIRFLLDEIISIIKKPSNMIFFD